MTRPNAGRVHITLTITEHDGTSVTLNLRDVEHSAGVRMLAAGMVVVDDSCVTVTSEGAAVEPWADTFIHVFVGNPATGFCAVRVRHPNGTFLCDDTKDAPCHTVRP